MYLFRFGEHAHSLYHFHLFVGGGGNIVWVKLENRTKTNQKKVQFCANSIHFLVG